MASKTGTYSQQAYNLLKNNPYTVYTSEQVRRRLGWPLSPSPSGRIKNLYDFPSLYPGVVKVGKGKYSYRPIVTPPTPPPPEPPVTVVAPTLFGTEPRRPHIATLYAELRDEAQETAGELAEIAAVLSDLMNTVEDLQERLERLCS